MDIYFKKNESIYELHKSYFSNFKLLIFNRIKRKHYNDMYTYLNQSITSHLQTESGRVIYTRSNHQITWTQRKADLDFKLWGKDEKGDQYCKNMGKADRFGKTNIEKNLTQGPLKKWDTCEWKKPNQSVKMLTEEDTKAIFIQWSLKYKQSYYLHAYTIWGNRCMAPSSFVCPPSSTFSMLSTTASGGAPTGVINQIPALNK